MAADYLISSLQPLALDGPAPYTMERFLEMCRDQLTAGQAEAIAAVVASPTSALPATGIAADWRDLDGQLRNAIAAERARIRGVDSAKWRHAVDGCSVYWANRVTTAFQEKDPAKRDRLLDQVRWDAAEELTPAASPLSVGAAFTYAIRLEIVIRRNAISAQAGNETFDRLTAVSKLELSGSSLPSQPSQHSKVTQ